jgi:cysteine desulfurase/selenocysteine lyase
LLGASGQLERHLDAIVQSRLRSWPHRTAAREGLSPKSMSGERQPANCKADFPILARQFNGKPLIYLDSAASSQKPNVVIDAMDAYYRNSHANVHRGIYALAEEATELYEGARKKVARFIGARHSSEIVFTKNVTESINLVANTWGVARLTSADRILLTQMEHHSNIVPWLMLKQRLGIELTYLGLDGAGHLILDDLDAALSAVKLVAVTGVSNVLGTINPVRTIADSAHGAGALVLVDAAQLVPHMPVDVESLGADFVAFTGHKMLGPTGIGVLWAKRELLESMPPFLGGGSMIKSVGMDGFSTNEVPHKFEAGTPPIAEAVGLAAAVKYLETIGMESVRQHEHRLTSYALSALDRRFGHDITIYGPSDPSARAGLISFDYRGTHPHDVAQILDRHGVCVRAGHHCAQPLMRHLGIAATTRASFHVYNNEADIDALVEALIDVGRVFG